MLFTQIFIYFCSLRSNRIKLAIWKDWLYGRRIIIIITVEGGKRTEYHNKYNKVNEKRSQ